MIIKNQKFIMNLKKIIDRFLNKLNQIFLMIFVSLFFITYKILEKSKSSISLFIT